MKQIFYVGLFGLAVFEILNIYFIMPMPGSQRMNSLELAYFLYADRWAIRMVCGLMLLIGAPSAFKVQRKWAPILSVAIVVLIIYALNFNMAADKMFLPPHSLEFAGRAEHSLPDSTLVIAVEHGGDARAYPVRFIVYHHQVRDVVGGKPMMITYCSVCRTGRVFEPVVNGSNEDFRLVGMDHFNAMFEDQTTGSWWRQATGEAVTGPLKGLRLPEVKSQQLSLATFFRLYPFGKVMLPDETSTGSYDSLARYERGKSLGSLTRTDTVSWMEKSWVIGIAVDGAARAYDWADVTRLRVIHDSIGNTPLVLVLGMDGQSFAGFERAPGQIFTVRNDSLISEQGEYDLSGRGVNGDLKYLRTYQEFWHSWKTFHPESDIYKPE